MAAHNNIRTQHFTSVIIPVGTSLLKLYHGEHNIEWKNSVTSARVHIAVPVTLVLALCINQEDDICSQAQH